VRCGEGRGIFLEGIQKVAASKQIVFDWVMGLFLNKQM